MQTSADASLVPRFTRDLLGVPVQRVGRMLPGGDFLQELPHCFGVAVPGLLLGSHPRFLPIWRQRSGFAHRARSNRANPWQSSGSRKIIPFLLSLPITLAPARELATTGKPQAMAGEDAIAGFRHGGTL